MLKRQHLSIGKVYQESFSKYLETGDGNGHDHYHLKKSTAFDEDILRILLSVTNKTHHVYAVSIKPAAGAIASNKFANSRRLTCTVVANIASGMMMPQRGTLWTARYPLGGSAGIRLILMYSSICRGRIVPKIAEIQQHHNQQNEQR